MTSVKVDSERVVVKTNLALHKGFSGVSKREYVSKRENKIEFQELLREIKRKFEGLVR